MLDEFKSLPEDPAELRQVTEFLMRQVSGSDD